MEINDQVFIHIQKFCKHFISQLRCKDLKIRYRPDGVPHLECLSILKHKTGRCDKVLCPKPSFYELAVIKPERYIILRIKGFIENLQPFLSI